MRTDMGGHQTGKTPFHRGSHYVCSTIGEQPRMPHRPTAGTHIDWPTGNVAHLLAVTAARFVPPRTFPSI